GRREAPSAVKRDAWLFSREHRSRSRTPRKADCFCFSRICVRYRAHAHGQRVAAEKQMTQVNKQMRLLLQRSLRDISEVEFLEEAVKQIIECRRILKWSYAFGYFADWQEAHQKHLFEYHQGQLERSLDLLQEKTETFDPDDFLGGERLLRLHVFKAELIDLTRVIGGFFRKICNVFEDEFCT
ncbi:ARIADNE family protein, partial [Toxoplasma gondii TgCatPRC2]